MAIIRTFIAAELSGTSLTWITSVQAELKNLVTPGVIKLTPLEQVHITLAFLGDVDTCMIPELVSAMDNCAIKLPIHISIDRIGQFSRNGAVAVIWAGIKQNMLLDDLYIELSKRISPLVKLEKSAFKAHITLARVRPEIDSASNARLIEFTNSNQEALPVQECFAEIVLFRSELKPSGPIYTKLHTIKRRDRIQ